MMSPLLQYRFITTNQPILSVINLRSETQPVNPKSRL
jgi:hypothetical protein